LAVEPANKSRFFQKGHAGAHKIQGHWRKLHSKERLINPYTMVVVPVQNEDAFTFGKEIAQRQKVCLSVISAGAALWGSCGKKQKKQRMAEKQLSLFFQTAGDRYLSHTTL